MYKKCSKHWADQLVSRSILSHVYPLVEVAFNLIIEFPEPDLVGGELIMNGRSLCEKKNLHLMGDCVVKGNVMMAPITSGKKVLILCDVSHV